MDEDIEIMNTQTRNEKIKNFFINNKNSLISILVIIILALIGYFSFEEYQSSKREKLADKYDLAVIRYEADNKYNVIPDLIEVINAKDKTYSPLAFYFLLDNDLINSKDEINNYFDILINDEKSKAETFCCTSCFCILQVLWCIVPFPLEIWNLS